VEHKNLDYNLQPPRYNPYKMPDFTTMIVISVLAIGYCLPCGIVALLKILKSQKAWNSGEYEYSLEEYEKSKKWCIAGIIILVVFFFLDFVAPLLFIFSVFFTAASA